VEQLLRGFGQWYEGSLLDWQIGDLYDMASGCTAGDVRSRYLVTDPGRISVIGAAVSADSGGAAAAAAVHQVMVVQPYRAPNGFEIAIVHAGLHQAGDMFRHESDQALTACMWARVAMSLGGLGAAYVSRAVPSWNRSILAEIYLCHACSCHRAVPSFLRYILTEIYLCHACSWHRFRS
jgi:hypothetical protein